MDYADFLPQYPYTDDTRLQQKLLNKKEFFDFRLETLARQAEPAPRDELQRHQRLIQRFLSPHTPYDELLLYHETGTGKTRAAFAATDGSGFEKVYFLARGDDQLKNARAELLQYFKSTPRFRDLPPSSSESNNVPLQTLIEQALGSKYEFWTWKTFVNRRIAILSKDKTRRIAILSDEEIVENFNNTIFIVDEIHNIRRVTPQSQSPTHTYTELHRLFHMLPNRKILLMSGTPMRDQVSDLADIMNLILPLDQQLPVGEAFNQAFVNVPHQMVRNGDRLKRMLKGRVSFLRAVPDTGVQRIFMGEYLDPELPAQQFRYFPTKMAELQRNGYVRAFAMDMQHQDSEDIPEEEDMEYASNFYSHSRQAALFVFPDGTWGKDGFQHYVHRQPQSRLEPHVYPIERLRQCSSKYAFIVEQLQSPNAPLMYIYTTFVDGSGLRLLARILEIYNFSRCRGTETQPGRRYMLLTSKPGEGDINTLIRYFNHERNARGDYCRVILGSRIISEGFTFKNVRSIHILTMHWNYTETQQAIARAIRFGSHSALFDHPAQIIPVEIYQHVSLTGLERPASIDLQMLATAQRKDVLIRRVTRLIKEISFDCPLVYARNNVPDGDPRECDYLPECEHKCDQVENADQAIDLSTFRLYYQESGDMDVWNAVRQFFERSTGDPVDFHVIEDRLQVDWFQLVRVLSEMIRYNTPVVNAYGMQCYLREDHNQYYLVENILLPNGHRDLAWYAQYPTVVETTSLKALLRQRGYPIYQRRIEELRTNPSLTLVNSLPSELRELYKSLQQQQRQTNVQSETDVFRDALSRGYDYYGTLDQSNKFRIVDIQDAKAEVTDVRKLKSGSVCLESGFNKDRIIRVYFALGVDVPLPEGFENRYPDPVAQIRSMKYGPELLLDPQLNVLSEPVDMTKLYTIIRLLQMSKSELCSTLREWMRGNNLLALILADVRGTKKTRLREVRT